jgi:nucleoid-associated protein YgaU
MDNRIKIAVSAGILLAGLLLALPFRRQSPPTDVASPPADDHLVLRNQAELAATPPVAPAVPVVPPEAQAAASRRPIVLKSADMGSRPPDLGKKFPDPSPAPSRWGTSLAQVLPDVGRAAPGVRRHKVVDGDSLSALADRYLGSADRAQEIFEANRDVLSDPRILLIGVELKLPPRDGPVATVPQAAAPATGSR